MDYEIQFVVGFVIFCLWAGSVIWAYRDAESRGKPGWIVALTVFVFWLLALGVWFAVRPSKKS